MSRQEDVFSVGYVKHLCSLLKIAYHHHDVFETPPYKEDYDLNNAICVVYSEPTGAWTLAFNQDGTVRFPWGSIRNMEEVLRTMLHG